MAFQTRDVLDLMQREAGVKLSTLKVDGGAAANDSLLQFQADLLDVTSAAGRWENDGARRGVSRGAGRRLLGESGGRGAQLGARARLRAVDAGRAARAALSGLDEGREPRAQVGGAVRMLPGHRRAPVVAFGLAIATAVAFAGADAPPRLLVLHKKASTLGLYDSSTGARLWAAPVGTKPHEMVLSPGDRYAYVTDYGVDSYNDTAEGGHTISIVDLEAGARVATIDLGRFRRPHGIALGFSGRVYITVDHPAAVLEVDTEARRVAAEHLLDQALPHMVAVSKDERYLYTANAGAGTDLGDRSPARRGNAQHARRRHPDGAGAEP
jgi:hypothetical protein